MRSLVLFTALLCHSLTAIASTQHGAHRGAHHALHARFEHDDRMSEAEKLRRRELYKRNAPAAEAGLATNYGDIAYDGSDYANQCLRHHNLHRSNHLAGEIEWDDWLAYEAQLVAQSCVYAHNLDSSNGQDGQNIAAGLPASNVSGVITELWYNNELPYFANQYGYAQPDESYFEQWAHLTQIVWCGTTHVGCATQWCPDGLVNVNDLEYAYFTVCNYSPPGNVEGWYDWNVYPPQGAEDVHWDS